MRCAGRVVGCCAWNLASATLVVAGSNDNTMFQKVYAVIGVVDLVMDTTESVSHDELYSFLLKDQCSKAAGLLGLFSVVAGQSSVRHERVEALTSGWSTRYVHITAHKYDHLLLGFPWTTIPGEW